MLLPCPQAAVGPLLTFADTRHERAFAAHFHTSHRSNDTFFFRMGAVVNLLALTLPLRQRQWWPVCFGLFESAVLASAALPASKAPTLYLRWRTAIVAAVYSLHVLISQTLAPSIASPGCRGNLLGFWLQELNMSLVRSERQLRGRNGAQLGDQQGAVQHMWTAPGCGMGCPSSS